MEDLYFAYARPQANGYKTDTRWVTFTDSQGNGIRITGSNPIGFSAHPQYNDDFDAGMTKKQRHMSEIVKRDLVRVNIDSVQMGPICLPPNDTDFCKMLQVLSKYRVPRI